MTYKITMQSRKTQKLKIRYQLAIHSQWYLKGQSSEHHYAHGKPITAWCYLSIPPENIQKPLGFLMFSGGIYKQHYAVMG